MLFNLNNSAYVHSETDVGDEHSSGGILPDSSEPKGRVVTVLLTVLSILATQRSSAHGSQHQPHRGACDTCRKPNAICTKTTFFSLDTTAVLLFMMKSALLIFLLNKNFKYKEGKRSGLFEMSKGQTGKTFLWERRPLKT